MEAQMTLFQIETDAETATPIPVARLWRSVGEEQQQAVVDALAQMIVSHLQRRRTSRTRLEHADES